MKSEHFDKIINDQLKEYSRRLTAKGDEYASSDNRLHNFQLAALLQDTTQSQALLGMLTKHVVSVYDLVRSGKSYSPKVWDEKIGDAVCYLLILRATVEKDSLVTSPPNTTLAVDFND